MFRIDIKYSSSFTELEKIVEETKGKLEFLRSVGDILVRRAKENIREQGYREDTVFRAWTPLSFSTILQKTRRGLNKEILNRTGSLKRSLSFNTNNKSLQITGKSYLLYHQTGTKRMPQRKVVSISREDKQKILSMFSKVMVERITRGS